MNLEDLALLVARAHTNKSIRTRRVVTGDVEGQPERLLPTMLGIDDAP